MDDENIFSGYPPKWDYGSLITLINYVNIQKSCLQWHFLISRSQISTPMRFESTSTARVTRHVALMPFVSLAVGLHYNDVIMGAMSSQITSLTIVYWTVYSGRDNGKHQSSASLAFVGGIHRSAVNSPHKWPVTRKGFSFDDVIMCRVTHYALLPFWFEG